MPFIDTKITMKVTPEKKETIKREMGKSAYVAVSLLGDAPKECYEKMTDQVCKLMAEELDIPGNAVYVTYHPVKDWGWNGSNF